MRLLRYICQLQRKASYLCWTSFFRKLIQCILYVGFKTSITGAYICWKPFIYRHSPYQFPYIWYMHVAIFTPHTTQPEWMAQYSLLCLSACIYITLFYMHFLFVCLFVCLKWAEQYIWSFFWCGIAACIWWFHGDWGMVTCPSTHEVKSSETVKKWEAYKGAEESKGQWRRSIADNVKKSEDDSTILYYQMSNNSFDTPQMDLWMSYREYKIMSTQLLLQFYEIDNVCRKKCTPDFIYSQPGM